MLGTSITSQSQTLARFSLDCSRDASHVDIPVTLNLADFHLPQGANFGLIQVIDKKTSERVPFQIDQQKNTISFVISRDSKDQRTKPEYELVKKLKPEAGKTVVKLVDSDGSLNIEAGQHPLLRYVYKTVYPPPGIDSSFRKSGFIHPLWTPHGQELTRIQPKDHYHHYGIWNPWTHVLYENDTIDFWNLGDKKGTVRFGKLISKTEGPVYAEIKSLHEHIVFKKTGGEKKALNEIQTIRVYRPSPQNDYYIMDFTSELTCASESPFHILAYRYAGFGWRATEYWDKDNSEMLTSEGKTRDNTDGSKARWCIVYGSLPGNEEGGAAMLSYPQNYNHPEPLRIWDKKANGGRGDVFANFAPTKDKDWILEPGKTYVLKYRLVVFSGKFDAAKAESVWQYFAKQPELNLNN
jgi:hypothetical protein